MSREIKYYAMSIFELRKAMNKLVSDHMNLEGHEEAECMLEMDCCMAVLDQKELSLLNALRR